MVRPSRSGRPLCDAASDPDRFGPGHAVGAPEQLHRCSRIALAAPARGKRVEGEIGHKCGELGRVRALREAETLLFYPALTDDVRACLTRRERSRLALFAADQQPSRRPQRLLAARSVFPAGTSARSSAIVRSPHAAPISLHGDPVRVYVQALRGIHPDTTRGSLRGSAGDSAMLRVGARLCQRDRQSLATGRLHGEEGAIIPRPEQGPEFRAVRSASRR